MKRGQLNSFLVFILITNIACEIQIGCFPWRNSYIMIENETKSFSNEVLIFTLQSRQSNGWLGIQITSNPNNFNNSISIVGYLPNKFVQLTNHTKEVNKTIFSENFLKLLFNSIDGIYSYSFKMNVSELKDKKFLRIALNSRAVPSEVGNQTFQIPKHEDFSKPIYFDFQTKTPVPICATKLNMASRILAQHPSIFIVTSIFYFVLGFLYVSLRNEQPLKSRFLGPMIGLCAIYMNLCTEYMNILIDFEFSSKIMCIVIPYFAYAFLQIS
jgi:hypothetical protein